MQRLTAIVIAALVLCDSAVAAPQMNLGVGYAGSVNVANSYTMSVIPSSPGLTIPLDFVGLSYEVSALVQTPAIGSNANLISILSVLGPHGSVRFGGNTSDSSVPSTARLQSAAAFVQALGSGWRMIFGTSCTLDSPSTSASQATTISAILGSLVTYQIGNEPNLYLSGPCLGFANYKAAWQSIHDAIVASVPAAKFGGSDIDVSPNVADTYSSQFNSNLGAQSSFLSIHLYGNPGSSGLASTAILTSWSDTTLSTEVGLISGIASGLPAQLTETGALSGGVSGISNTMGAALNALAGMSAVANAGWSGVNFHGGDATISSPFYAPVLKNGDGTYSASPTLYAMVIFEYLVGGRIIPVTSSLPTFIPAIAVLGSDGKVRILLVNKSLTRFNAVSLTLPNSYSAASQLTFTAADCGSTAAVIGASSISSAGAFSPSPLSLPVVAGKVTIIVPACSAALIALQ